MAMRNFGGKRGGIAEWELHQKLLDPETRATAPGAWEPNSTVTCVKAEAKASNSLDNQRKQMHLLCWCELFEVQWNLNSTDISFINEQNQDSPLS